MWGGQSDAFTKKCLLAEDVVIIMYFWGGLGTWGGWDEERARTPYRKHSGKGKTMGNTGKTFFSCITGIWNENSISKF